MMTSEMQRTTMIDGQILPNKVTDPRVISALGETPREAFVPKALRSVAYIDEDLEIGADRYLMEPMVFARLVEAAEITADDLVLDVGSNLGYSAAILAKLASSLVGVDSDGEMVAQANANLLKLEIGNAAVVEGVMQEGVEKEAPFNVIFLNGCVEYIPQALIDQLAEGGRMVGVRMENGLGRGFLGVKSGGIFGVEDFMDANVPMLPGFAETKKFEF